MRPVILMGLLLILSNCQSKSNQNVYVKQEEQSQTALEEKLNDPEYENIFRVAKTYLEYDFKGARLRGDHPLHDAFFSESWGTAESISENVCVVDTFRIRDILLGRDDASAVVRVEFPKAVEMDPEFSILHIQMNRVDTLIIKNKKIISGNDARVSKNAIIDHAKLLFAGKSDGERITKKIEERLSTALEEGL